MTYSEIKLHHVSRKRIRNNVRMYSRRWSYRSFALFYSFTLRKLSAIFINHTWLQELPDDNNKKSSK